MSISVNNLPFVSFTQLAFSDLYKIRKIFERCFSNPASIVAPSRWGLLFFFFSASHALTRMRCAAKSRVCIYRYTYLSDTPTATRSHGRCSLGSHQWQCVCVCVCMSVCVRGGGVAGTTFLQIEQEQAAAAAAAAKAATTTTKCCSTFSYRFGSFRGEFCRDEHTSIH